MLVVSPAGKLGEALVSLLTESRYRPVKVVSSVSAAKRAWDVREYDLVIVNSPLADDPGIRFAIDVCESRHAVALLVVQSDIHGEVRSRVEDFGVFTLPKPTTRPLVALALTWMGASLARLGRLEERALSVEEKMAEIRLVNRAKWILISDLGMDEPSAHRLIEKRAMDRCVSRREIAQEIVDGT
ncbi:MAG: ANTAR domain-containing protein [Atopobiaceae bacterium]|nr:ANTAR domain-containing protein [Atopobiaceae bacterium]